MTMRCAMAWCGPAHRCCTRAARYPIWPSPCPARSGMHGAAQSRDFGSRNVGPRNQSGVTEGYWRSPAPERDPTPKQRMSRQRQIDPPLPRGGGTEGDGGGARSLGYRFPPLPSGKRQPPPPSGGGKVVSVASFSAEQAERSAQAPVVAPRPSPRSASPPDPPDTTPEPAQTRTAPWQHPARLPSPRPTASATAPTSPAACSPRESSARTRTAARSTVANARPA